MSIPRHSKAELNAVAVEAQAGDQAAAAELATMMSPYVVAFFRKRGQYRYRNYSRDQRDEMTQHAWIGVWTALARFDPSKGVKFSTYAYHWMQHEVMEYIAKNSGTLPVSRKAWHMADLVEREWRYENPDDYRQVYEVPREELADIEVGVMRDKQPKTLRIDGASDIFQARKSPYVFDADYDASADTETPEDALMKKDASREEEEMLAKVNLVADALLELPARERLAAAESFCEELGWPPEAAEILLEMRQL